MDDDTRTMSERSGPDLLRAFLMGPPRRSQEWLADAIGTTQAAISLWLNQKFRPSEEYREALEIVAGIPRDTWRTPDERALVDRARVRCAGDSIDHTTRPTGTEG